MIIDGHMHVFPSIFRAEGFNDRSEHLAAARRFFFEHLSQPPRRADDHRIEEGSNQVLGVDTTLQQGDSRLDFTISQCGRFTWRTERGGYYTQFFPPYMTHMECSPEQATCAMEYVGIDMAVLVSASPPLYGKLNRFYAEEVLGDPRFRARFLPLAHIDFPRNDGMDQSLQQLESDRAAGLKGLFIGVDESCFLLRYRSFWDAVADTALPVYLTIYPKKGAWTESVRAMAGWVSRYPRTPAVLTHAFPLSTRRYNDSIRVDEDIRAMILESSLLLEVSYPVSRGFVEEYPFPVTQEALRVLYESFGAKKLIWGSDYPVVERFCTYGQSLSYLTTHCGFIPDGDLKRLTGGNLARLFGLRGV